MSYVLPVSHFLAEIWLPRKTQSKGDKVISNRVGSHIKLLTKVHTTAASVILPVFRGNYSPVLFRGVKISPSDLALENLVRRATFRTHKLKFNVLPDRYKNPIIRIDKTNTAPLMGYQSDGICCFYSDSLDQIKI